MKIKFVLVFGIIILVGAFISADTFTPVEIVPEDYSFRSGLNYQVDYYGDLNGDGLAEGFPIKEEYSYWRTRYPFVDPKSGFADKYGPFDHVTDMVGFKARVVRDPSMVGNDVSDRMYSGSVSNSVALIPYLEASKTVVRDKNFQEKTYGTLTRYDEWMNPAIVYNLGDMGEGDFIEGGFYSYYVRNPYAFDNPMVVSSEFTNLQRQGKTNFTDTVPEDNTVTYINYLGATDGVDIYHVLALISASDSVDSGDAKNLRFFYGWNNQVDHVLVTDGFGRVLSNSEIKYNFLNDVFEDCNADSNYFSVEYYNCLANTKIKLHPFDDTRSNPSDGGNEGSSNSEYCMMNSPYKIYDYGDLAMGFYPLSEEDSHPTKSVSTIFYDRCGNVLETDTESKYKHGYEETPLVLHNEAGVDEYKELLHEYNKTVNLIYLGKRFKPTSVTIQGDPNLTTSATYVGGLQLIGSITNERGVTTEYEYDELGRITKFWIPPDTFSEPTGKYYYLERYGSDCPGNVDSCLVIKEEKKIDNGLYTESYHFYDGMGRHVQTQVKESDNAMIVTMNKYDVFNRLTHEARPLRVEEVPIDGYFGVFYSSPLFVYRTYTYDALNRVLEVHDFDSGVTTKEYTFLVSSTIDANNYDKVNVEDPEGNSRSFYSDSRGNLLSVSLPTP